MKRQNILTELGITGFFYHLSYYSAVENTVMHSGDISGYGFAIWILLFIGFLLVMGGLLSIGFLFVMKLLVIVRA